MDKPKSCRVKQAVAVLATVMVGLAPLLAPGRAAAEEIRYFHLDALGTVRALTDESGVVVERHDYLPFGDECVTGPCASNPSAAAGEPLKYTGKERDAETGLDYFGARYYRAGFGRFTTIDPAMTVEKNVADPLRWNRYGYARNNPLRFVDPDGREQAVIVAGRTYMAGVDGLSAGDEPARDLTFNILTFSVNLAVAGTFGFAAGGLRQAGKAILQEVVEEATGLPPVPVKIRISKGRFPQSAAHAECGFRGS